MLNSKKTIKVIIEHQRTEKPDSLYNEFHEWVITKTWVRANSKGIANPRMNSAEWLKAVCNNKDCAALALVNVQLSIEQDFPIAECLNAYDSTH